MLKYWSTDYSPSNQAPSTCTGASVLYRNDKHYAIAILRGVKSFYLKNSQLRLVLDLTENPVSADCSKIVSGRRESLRYSPGGWSLGGKGAKMGELCFTGFIGDGRPLPSEFDPQSAIWKNTDGWEKIRLIFGLAELSRKLNNLAKNRLNTKILRLKFSWLQTISAELLNLNWNDC